MRIVVDSAFRNKSLWPRPDTYEIRLQSPVNNVEGIRLVESNIPFTSLTVGPGGDRMYVRSPGGRARGVQVEHADYVDGTELAAAVQVALDAQASDLGISVTYRDMRMHFESPNTFLLDDTDTGSVDYMQRPVSSVVDDSMARTLGLDANSARESSPGAGGQTYTAPYAIELGGENYLVLSLDIAGDLVSSESSMTSALSTVTQGQREYRSTAFVALNPRRTVDRLRVNFTRPTGGAYDFMGKDHRLEFITTFQKV